MSDKIFLVQKLLQTEQRTVAALHTTLVHLLQLLLLLRLLLPLPPCRSSCCGFSC